MRIIGARVSGFRNLADLDLEFSRGVNVLQGRNGQGKTNLMEALYFPAYGRSHRGARAEELIAHRGASLHVSLLVEAAADHNLHFEFGLDRDGGRRFRIDGELVERRGDLVGRLAALFFWPESSDLVRGGPDQRRRFADQGLCGLDHDYLVSLVSYQRALRQKSSLLRSLRQGDRDRATARREMQAWNADLARHAAVIGEGRAAWAERLQPHAGHLYGALSGVEQPLGFRYRPRLQAFRKAANEGARGHELLQDIFAEFDYIGPEEVRRGRPLTGVQFDDFEACLGSQDLRTFGSQGETRTAAIALILAQSEVISEVRRVRPVLFLDDIFSELDRERARRLQERCARDHQLFIATARADDVAGWNPEGMRQWRVEDGRLASLP